MNDKKCVLVELTNEDNKLAVGYIAWIVEEKYKNENALRKVINNNNEIEIKWPDCEVEPENEMRKKVIDCQWSTCKVIILAHGEWTALRELRSKVIKFGKDCLKNTSRRAGAAKRPLISPSEDMKTSNTDPPKKSKILHLERNFDDTDELMTLSKEELVNVIQCLYKENRQLKDDKTTLQLLAKTNNNLQNVEQLSVKIIQNLKAVQEKCIDLQSQASIIILSGKNNEKLVLPTSNTKASGQPDDQGDSNQDKDINNMMEDSSRFEKCVSTAETDKSDGKEKFTIDEKKLSRCSFSNSTKLTNDLLNVVFTKIELQTSTITGEKVNLHLDKPAKTKLNEAKVAFIYEFVEKHFPAEKNVRETIKRTIQRKCNNAVPRKRIQNKMIL